VEYLAEYMDVLTDFTTTLPETAKCVQDLCELLREHKAQLKAQTVLIVEHSVEIVANLTKLEETSVPTAHNIASKLEDLQMQSEYSRTAGAEDWLPHTTELLGQFPELLQSAMASCSIKLQTVLEKHPCLHLFTSLTVLDSAQLVGARKDIKDYVHAIPALSQVSAEEWHRYVGINKADAMELCSELVGR
jgi:hypothetical protein